MTQCKKCGCFWNGYNPDTCRGVWAEEDNMVGVVSQYYPRFMTVQKKGESALGASFPVFEDTVDHIWIECLRQALYVELELLDCKIRVHPDKGIEEVRRLKGKPLLWLKEKGWQSKHEKQDHPL